MDIIDRRLNPKKKSLDNRQRFLLRARGEIKDAVRQAIRGRKVKDKDGTEKTERRSITDTGEEKITIPTKGISEPIFHHNRRSGRTHHVIPGNKEYVQGDEIPRPTGGGGAGGSEASPQGSGEDAFEFMLTRDEFLDMFFEDLELPDMVHKGLKDTSFSLQRAGYTMTGSPQAMSIPLSMRKSLARRIALHRPKPAEIDALERELEEAQSRDDEAEVERLTREIAAKKRRMGVVPYIDPIDVRYRRFDKVPKPNADAVMFCIMDVSGSMTEAMKDLAKRFFMLLHTFLTRRYRQVEVVFIRHTDKAQEVDEETFFYSRETGGTVVSPALDLMVKIVNERYPLDRWNVYGAQASDGDNYGTDSAKCASVLDGEVLPLCQYYAYVEVGDGQGGSLTGLSRGSDLWRGYETVAPTNPHFAMRKLGNPADVFAVFHELFKKGGIHA
ncbi:MAG: YeaH/YhbH family protein [bacterium]|nr:YeaH/YhbH family protein [bacterium]